LSALERQFPQIYSAQEKLLIDLDVIRIQREDFTKSLRRMVPSTHRVRVNLALPLSSHFAPLLSRHLDTILRFVHQTFPIAQNQNSLMMHGQTLSFQNGMPKLLQTYRPRLLIHSTHPNNGTLFSMSC
jgi:hypothetical protein